MRVGDTLTFRATVPSAVMNPQFKWSSSDSTKVAADTLGRAHAKAATPGVAFCAEVKGLAGCAQVIVTPSERFATSLQEGSGERICLASSFVGVGT